MINIDEIKQKYSKIKEVSFPTFKEFQKSESNINSENEVKFNPVQYLDSFFINSSLKILIQGILKIYHQDHGYTNRILLYQDTKNKVLDFSEELFLKPFIDRGYSIINIKESLLSYFQKNRNLESDYTITFFND